MTLSTTNSMTLTHEFNEYLVGIVVTDINTNRSVNFQYERVDNSQLTNYYYLKYGCIGDDTYKSFTDDELTVISNYVCALDNKETLEQEMTTLLNSESTMILLDMLSIQGYISYSDIIELYEDIVQ